jgi:TolA-binding protein
MMAGHACAFLGGWVSVVALSLLLVAGSAFADTLPTKPDFSDSTGAKGDGRGAPSLTLDQLIEAELPDIPSIIDCVGCPPSKVDPKSDDPEKPSLDVRLAWLYANLMKEIALDQKIPTALAAQQEQLRKEKGGYHKAAEESLATIRSSITAAEARKSGRVDEVLFKLAYLLDRAKQHDQARAFFRRLLKDYPHSKYVPLVNALMGDYFVNKGDPGSALKFYRLIKPYPKSGSLYAFASYKAGRCLHDLGSFEFAINTFTSVIHLLEDGKNGGSREQNMALMGAARIDLVKAYARAPGFPPERAWSLFRRIGGDFSPQMLEDLAEAYFCNGAPAASTRTYRQIILHHPGSPRLCEWQSRIVRDAGFSDKRDLLREMKKLARAYDGIRKLTSARPEQIEGCGTLFRSVAKDVAREWHAQARQACFNNLWAFPIDVIEAFLDRFPNDPDASEMRFRYAELLSGSRPHRWREAALQYEKTVLLAPNGEYAERAAYGAVLAREALLPLEDRPGSIADSTVSRQRDKGNGEKHLGEKTIPSRQEKLVSACNSYIKVAPDGPRSAEVKYRKGRVLYAYNHFDEAAGYFQEIVEKHGTDALTIAAAKLLLECLDKVGRVEELTAWVDRLLAQPDLMKDEEFRRELLSRKSHVGETSP